MPEGPPLQIHHNADETFYLFDGAYVARSAQVELLAQVRAGIDRFFEELGGIPVIPGQPAPATSCPDPEARAVAGWGWRSSARR
jgi:hypothetical protein